MQQCWKSLRVSSTRHFLQLGNMSTQHYLTFFSRRGRNQHKLRLSGRENKTDVDPQQFSRLKKRVFKSKWLEEFSWLMYSFTDDHMKCKTCLDTNGCLATNFQRSALDRHQLGNKHTTAVRNKEDLTKRSRGRNSRLGF